MKTLMLIIVTFLLISGCDTTETDTGSDPRATTEYSRTLDHVRETAEQVENSLSTRAQRAQDARK